MTPPTSKWSDKYRHKQGYRSGLEKKIAAQLRLAGVDASYESLKIQYTLPPHTYTPDFLLPNGIIIETKGYFLPEDRTKHKAIKSQHPDLDIRFVFSNPRAFITTSNVTTYAQWCEKNGFLWANKSIPDSWIQEKKKNKTNGKK